MVSYRINPAFDIAEVIAVLRSSSLNRPADDPARLRCMFDHADLTVGAYDGSRLIGYARALSDRAWACYLADLAGTEAYQGQGVGRAMVDCIRAEIGDRGGKHLVFFPPGEKRQTPISGINSEIRQAAGIGLAPHRGIRFV